MEKNLIFGKNSVEALLKNSDRSINKIFILNNIKRDQKIQTIIKLANNEKIPVSFAGKDKFKKILQSEVNHQGVIASVSPVEFFELDDLIRLAAKKKDTPLLILLDSIEDPQNLGSILRSAEVLGADGVIIPNRRSAQITDVVAKVSSGALEYIPVCQVTNISKTIERLKTANYWVYGAEFEPSSKFIYEADYNCPCVVVMGSEGKGLSRLVKESCDVMIKIPQVGKISSLNVANALSVIIYEILRQRTT